MRQRILRIQFDTAGEFLRGFTIRMLFRKQQPQLIMRFPVLRIEGNGAAQQRFRLVLSTARRQYRLRQLKLRPGILRIRSRPRFVRFFNSRQVRARLIEHAAKKHIRLLDPRIDRNRIEESNDGLFEAALPVARHPERERELGVLRIRLQRLLKHRRSLREVLVVEQQLGVIEGDFSIRPPLVPGFGQMLSTFIELARGDQRAA